jgi:hypothetical protein
MDSADSEMRGLQELPSPRVNWIRRVSRNIHTDISGVRREGDDRECIPYMGFFFFCLKRLKTHLRNTTR